MADYELTQIEDYFNDQRAQSRWSFKRLDSTDWSYMDAWQKDGIPFAVICRGIAEVFEQQRRKAPKDKINTVRYCEGAIKRHWRDHVAAHVGSNGGEAAAGHQAEFGVERILEAMQYWIDCLQTIASRFSHDSENVAIATDITEVAMDLSRLRAGITQEPDYETLDARLAGLEGKLIATILDAVDPEHLAALKCQGEKEFAKYKELWMGGMWDQTIQNFIHKSLREQYCIPRLSLFYL